jgi:transposase-like protein
MFMFEPSSWGRKPDPELLRCHIVHSDRKQFECLHSEIYVYNSDKSLSGSRYYLAGSTPVKRVGNNVLGWPRLSCQCWIIKAPKTLQQAILCFSDSENCRQFMITVRWEDGTVRCPICDSEKVTYLAKARAYRCHSNHPRQKFSLKVGTIFEGSPIALEKWLSAVWLLGELPHWSLKLRTWAQNWGHSEIGVVHVASHSTGNEMKSGSFVRMGSDGFEVEADEAFIRGKAKNMHEKRRNALRKVRY